MSMCDLPIDAEFCVDFKNAYFCIPILRIFRVMVILRPKQAPSPQNVSKWISGWEKEWKNRLVTSVFSSNGIWISRMYS